MRNNNLWPVWLFVSCLIGMLLGKFCFSTTKDKVELSLFNGKPSKLQSVINIVENRYVDEIDIDSLVELVIPDVLSRLDPHSSYTPYKDRNIVESDIVGQYCGIGIECDFINDTMMVIYTNHDGPAHEAGLRPGDKIVMVDSTNVVKSKEGHEMLSGELGSKVTLSVVRMGCDSIIPIEIKRDFVPVKCVKGAYMADSTTGYIRLESFGDYSHIEFMAKIKQLKEQNVSHLIIDLRNNGGGRLYQAVQILSEILPKGDTITFTVKRGNEIADVFTDTTQAALSDKMRIVCLVNSHTASASEIMVGALQDNDRAIIMGRRTFGKGLVQTPIQLTDGSVVRLTTFRYYTPSGRSLQKGYEDYNNDIRRRWRNGEMDSASAYKADDSTEYHTRTGRVVYSKGGVSPDVFLPEPQSPYEMLPKAIDTTIVLESYAALRYAAIPKTDSTDEVYIRTLSENPDACINGLYEYMKSLNLISNPKKEKKLMEENSETVMALLMSFAYHITGNEDEYYHQILCIDHEAKEALSLINDDTRYNNILTTETKE